MAKDENETKNTVTCKICKGKTTYRTKEGVWVAPCDECGGSGLVKRDHKYKKRK